MKKIILSFCFLACVSATNAQLLTKTDRHLPIKGSKVFMIPPKGFLEAKNFSGFGQESTNSSIMVSSIPTSYFKMVDAFTEPMLKTRKMNLISKSIAKVQQYDGMMFDITQIANDVLYQKYVLMFGDSTNTILVNGLYPKDMPELDSLIKNALLSTFYENLKLVDHEKEANFSINTLASSMKFATSISGGLLYTSDGKLPVKTENDNAMFTVAQSLGYFNSADQKKSAIERLKTLPRGDKTNIESILPITVNGLNGYSIKAWGVDSNSEKELVCQTMLFAKDSYYILIGMATNNFEKYVQEFSQLTKSFKLKP
jgi:hypothetical protein